MIKPNATKEPESHGHTYKNNVLEQDLSVFKMVVESVKEGIRAGINPERISQGTSGSYFMKGIDGRTIGVFKPKEEEPYSQMNPKWSKWLHRTCCPCCFGRSCIMVGVGYVSEVAASVVDRFLSLDMVPRTEIVELAAPTFYYTLLERWQAHNRRQSMKEMDGSEQPYSFYRGKFGSFQLFANDFRPAIEIFRELEGLPEMPTSLIDAIHGEFERLVVLDYVIRNTDRGLDNLLMRIDWVAADGTFRTQPGFTKMRPIVKMAAIDNGLAFPYKHPDNWRSYPYGWSSMEPYIHRPFSEALRGHLLKLLENRETWDDLEDQLRMVFRIDVDFREKHFQRQMSVFRGQLRNLLEVLRRPGGGSPADLLQMEPMLIQEEQDYLRDVKKSRRAFPPGEPIVGVFDDEDTTHGHPRWRRPVTNKPWLEKF